ncbi:O-antigen ligase family protein [Deinococcus pimensis]|uniref:O-antigen ligase family protein n=1 Tax=Deinococcus pimensis TaxID=309888 RepID=UPI0004892141|nr:O-antigen ligase family protein [Deinococcus pimensis]
MCALKPSTFSWTLKPPGVTQGVTLVVTGIALLTTYQLNTLGPQFSQQPLPLLIGFGTLAVHLLRRHDLPLLAWLWWASGLLTLLWSRAPGDTINLALWELTYLAAFIAGRTRHAATLVLGLLLLNGLYTNLVSITLGGISYLSGSSLYTSAAQALPLLPVGLTLWLRHPRLKVWAAGVTVLAAYAVAMSGSRSVTVPALLVSLLALGLLHRKGVSLRVLGSVVLTMALGVAAIDAVVPKHPLLQATTVKGAMTVSTADAEQGGNLQTRLQMWEAAADLAWRHPLGVGNGAYQNAFQAYLRWPVYFSRFPHNYYLETVATGGWARMITLLLLLGLVLRASWREGRWSWGLGALGLWLSLLTDITGDMPLVMIAAFVTLGAAFGPTKATEREDLTLGSSVARFGGWGWSALLIAVTLAWFWPLRTLGSPLQQHLAWLPELKDRLPHVSPAEADLLLDHATRMNPDSFDPYRLRLALARTPAQQERALQEVIERFPYAYLRAYLDLAALKTQQQDVPAAQVVLKQGIERFSRTTSPLGLTLTPYHNKELLRAARKELNRLLR